MINTLRILQKVLINYFYATNSGFFLFIFFVLFGMPYSPLAFHLSLITGFTQSQKFLSLVLLVWLLYNFKCLDYILKQLRQPRQNFLYCITNLPSFQIYLYMFYVQAFVYAPVFIYALFAVFIAIKKGQYFAVAEMVLFNIIIVATSALVYAKAIQRKTSYTLRVSLPRLRIGFAKPLFLIPVYFLWNDRKQMLFITKIFSLSVLYGFIKLYEPERYDIRPLQLCLLLTAVTHAAIIYQLRLFEEQFLSFSRNLPMNTLSRFVRIVAMNLILLLPEFILLIKGYRIHFSIADYPQLVLLEVALLSLFHVVLVIEATQMEQFIRIVFGIIAGCFFILLYNPGLILSAAILLLTFALFSTYYYDYEEKNK